MTRLRPAGLVALVAYVTAIVSANYLTNRYGLVSVGFGYLVTAGTYAAGFALLARDYVQRFAGILYVFAGIILGTVVSWATTSNARLAVASALAFLVGELVDLAVFTGTLQRLGMFGGALLSNVISAPVDTVVFLLIAGFPVTTTTVVGQFIGKVLWATLVPLALIETARRAVLREPVD